MKSLFGNELIVVTFFEKLIVKMVAGKSEDSGSYSDIRERLLLNWPES
jgi:hypothetical protein